MLEEYPLEKTKQNRRIKKPPKPRKNAPRKKKAPPHQNWSFMLYHITYYYYHTHPVEL